MSIGVIEHFRRQGGRQVEYCRLLRKCEISAYAVPVIWRAASHHLYHQSQRDSQARIEALPAADTIRNIRGLPLNPQRLAAHH